MPRSRVREETAPFRRPTNVSLDAALVEQARELGINVSRACEDGLSDVVRAERRRRWIEENREAMEASNAYVAENGLPLAKYRMF
ncbi:MAG: post-segregation antitoxin CcdA [Sphingomonas sp.]|uniref:type II toxin-antitoxin system CcdA family antitoxin n=1 Tax=Sphingomonas sp. TaxID=28214 RepID=UPI00120AB125|nr:type II toxin-antitoxin system CcdA family antitoxin [Sphingomonas sp.]THD36745.1 MAG: post-segregation antitoxin CcdA [Sphingomonas sp.]